MTKSLFLASLTAVFVCVVVLPGCSDQPSSTTPPTTPGAPQLEPSTDDHEGHDHADHAKSGAGDAADSASGALAELSQEDRELAETQKICPVSGQPLGAMGKPFKVTVQGRDVLLCCPSCESEIKADPEKYLAKLDKQ